MSTLPLFLCLIIGGCIAAGTIAFYQNAFIFCRQDKHLAAVFTLLFAGIMLSGPATSPSWQYPVIGLLFACTLTDALRGWLPFPLVIPLTLAGLVLSCSVCPDHLLSSLFWCVLWGGLFAGRRLYLYCRRSALLPGSGDIFLIAAIGACSGAASIILLSVSLLGHALYCITRQQAAAPFGPFLAISLLVWLVSFF